MKTRDYLTSYKDHVQELFLDLSNNKQVLLNEYNNQVISLFLSKLLSLNKMPFFIYGELELFTEDNLKLIVTVPINDNGINWQAIYNILYT